MKPKLILCLALVLSGGLFGCATNNAVKPNEPKPVSFQGELTWPTVATGQWEFTPKIVSERFKHASMNALGSDGDIAEINQIITADNPRPKNLRVTDLRWLSSTLAMAKVRAMEAGFVYVIEKKAGQWKVIAHYTQWIS